MEREGNDMTLYDSKKKLALAGAVCGIVAAILAFMGNPANMAFCIACFVRDMAGSMGMHQAEVVQYARPEIVGLVLGAFIISVATKEYRSTAGLSCHHHFPAFLAVISRNPVSPPDLSGNTPIPDIFQPVKINLIKPFGNEF